MDRVFGDFRLGILGDILDDSLPRPLAALQRLLFRARPVQDGLDNRIEAGRYCVVMFHP
jgi:hypothetical protein